MIEPNLYKYISLHAYHQTGASTGTMVQALARSQLSLETTFNIRISSVQESMINKNLGASFKVREFSSDV